MSETKDRSDAPKAKTFDEAWDSIPDASGESEGGTKAWTEEVRGARKHDGEPTQVEETRPHRTDTTRAWTEDVRGARKQGPLVPQRDEMDRLMQAEPAGEPPIVEELEPSASTSMMSFDALDLPEPGKPDASLMDALMGSEGGDVSKVRRSKPPGVANADRASDDPLPPPIVLHPGRPPAAHKPNTALVEPRPAKAKRSGRKRLSLLVGGSVAAGLALWFGREPRPKPAPPDANAGAGAVDLDPKSLGPVTTVDGPPTAQPDVGTDTPVPRARRQPPPASDPNRDPREPPEGTPEEIAAVFTKLPVSPADQAPVGGVGKTGIHVDDVSMGNTYEQSRCSGGDGTFSVSKDELVNVCLRVVHQREKEELSIVWQKVDGNARRGKIVVKPLHAYRTRAYLQLRGEYVGDWEVTVFSEDGVELAGYPFTIVP